MAEPAGERERRLSATHQSRRSLRTTLRSVLNFVLAPDGIFFVPEPADDRSSIRFFNFRTRATTYVAPIQGSVAIGLSLSPDGRHILYSETDQQSSELMLVENFR
jgi:hypothetical protein